MRTSTWSTKLAKSMARPNVGMHSLPGMPNDVDLSNPLKAWRRRGSPEDRRDGESRAWLTRRTWRYGQGIEGQTRPWPRMLQTTANSISRASVSFLASLASTFPAIVEGRYLHPPCQPVMFPIGVECEWTRQPPMPLYPRLTCS